MIAIDLGSNTLRVLLYDCKTKKALFSYEKVVKTADGLAKFGTINNDALSRIILAIKEAQKQIDFSSHTIRAVTTEAVRRASNATEILLKIKKETYIDFEIISGEEEARLTLLAVKNRLNKLHTTEDNFVLVDIGGGSTEIIFHKNNTTVSKSFSVGIVTIAQKYKTLEDIKRSLYIEMNVMQNFCKQMIADNHPKTFVATAGTPTTVAAMKLGYTYANYNAEKINGTKLAIEELDYYLKKLLTMPFEAREIAVGTKRSDLVSAGILIYKALYEILGFKSCMVVDDGLREGVALDMCSKI